MSSHASEDSLRDALHRAEQQVSVGGNYYHYKNLCQLYKVTDLVISEETEEVMVIYEARYGTMLTWARSLSSWLSEPEPGVKRFSLAE